MGIKHPFSPLYEYSLVFRAPNLASILNEVLTLSKLSHMKKTILKSFCFILLGSSIFLTACGNNTSTNTATMDSASNVAASDSAVSYDISLVQNKKDPTCGMPVTAGISDTVHYDNKVLGFCSPGCKEEFLKNPKANMTAAEMQ